MWEKPTHRKIEGTARPLRIAYLVDLENCDHLLIDEIIAESFSRWSGRRTPIIPASSDGVDPRYLAWLHYFDADVIYSFADLTDEAVTQLDEYLAPGILHHHKDPYRDPEGDRRYRVEMPVQGLSCLSVLPIFASRRWGFGDKPRNILSFDTNMHGTEDQFLRENFGFLSTSFRNGLVADSGPELFSCLTLVSEEWLQNDRYGKRPHGSYESDPNAFLRTLADASAVLPPSHLSEMFCHYIEPRNSLKDKGVNIVVGDTISDRLLYWNGHNRFPRNELSSISSIRISREQSNSDDFLGLLERVIDRRGTRGDQNSPVFTVRSTSLSEAELSDVVERIKPGGNTWKRYEFERVPDASWAVPEFWEERAYFRTSSAMVFGEPASRQRAELADGRAELPLAVPWHLTETYLPPSVRTGQWMVDLSIERENDHCRFSNVVHEWLLPRRLRIDHFFSVKRENTSSNLYPRYCQRPTQSGLLSVSLELTVRQASISIPADEDALVGSLRDNRRDRFLRTATGESGEQIYPPKARDVRYSDKGRYLLGTLQHFQSLPDAFNTLMHDFWREMLRNLGADPSRIDDELEARLATLISKRLRAPDGNWEVTGERERQVVVREALKLASQIKRPARFIRYDRLNELYNRLLSKFVDENPHVRERGSDDVVSEDELDASIQYLCDRKVLFQGHEWQCRNCFNRNWVSIDELAHVMKCNVCQSVASPPVSECWHFRASSFIIAAFSDHGTEPAIWALWKLSERARASFYFVPSSLVWYENYREDGENDCEIDLLAIVDGKTYAVEATASKNLKDAEIDKLAAFATRVRPDVISIACAADTERTRDRLKQRIEEKIPDGVSVEVLEYRTSEHQIDPYLPY